MNRIGSITIGLVVAVSIFLSAGAACAQDIKERMRARLPDIVNLKSQGVIGENNQGYLTILKTPTDQQGVVDAENHDRRKIYGAIAKKQGTEPALVGQRRAMKIAQKAVPGTMIQDANGTWRLK